LSKIVFIAPGEQLAELVRGMLHEFDFEVDLRIGYMEQGVDIAKSLDKTEVDVVISRGGTAALIKAANIEIPLVEVSITGEEIVHAIKSAKVISGKANPSVAYIGFENMMETIRIFSEIINVDFKIYPVHSFEDISLSVQEAKKNNIDVIIGGIMTTEYARKNNMNAVFLESTRESIMAALKIAHEVRYARLLGKRKAEELKTILDATFEAIIGTDDMGRITVINSAAKNFFNIVTDDVISSDINALPGIVDADDIAKVFGEGRQVLAKIVRLKDRTVVKNVTPIVHDGKVENVIISFQEIERIQKVEAKIREELYLKGNVAEYTFADIQGQSPSISETKRIAENFAKLDSIVLMYGETGTGKELFAQSIHNASLRNNEPFVALNCGAMPSNLVESELFGYSDGAFTGAKKGGKKGLFEIAHGGTLFLDEISEMDKTSQVMLLRVIQEKLIRRIGDDKVIPVNVRIIAATNRNLSKMVVEHKFREDLFYRLNVLTLNIPSLRDRRGDVEYLLRYFIGEFGKKFYKYVSLSEDAIAALKGLPWYGNVRQLENFCERIVAIASVNVIDLEFVTSQLADILNIEVRPQSDDKPTLPQSNSSGMDESYSERIVRLLRHYNGNKSKVAKELGICRTTLWRLMRELQIVHDFSGKKQS
jgi:transcriptional regulator with PAS, ATPase and Fis domain